MRRAASVVTVFLRQATETVDELLRTLAEEATVRPAEAGEGESA